MWLLVCIGLVIWKSIILELEKAVEGTTEKILIPHCLPLTDYWNHQWSAVEFMPALQNSLDAPVTDPPPMP